MTTLKYTLWMPLLPFLFAACATSTKTVAPVPKGDILWNFIETQCVPNQQKNHDGKPCEETNLDKGYVVFKDRNGPLQYLLMPTMKITGMESPYLLEKESPPYFLYAWQARSYVEKKYGKPVDPEILSLTINSQMGRSQNQLHIHISCTREDVLKQLQKMAPTMNSLWRALPEPLAEQNFMGRLVTEDEMKEENPFRLLANEYPDAKVDMKSYGMALVPLPQQKDKPAEFILLATHAENDEQRGSAELIQDHDCPQLYPNAKPATPPAPGKKKLVE